MTLFYNDTGSYLTSDGGKGGEGDLPPPAEYSPPPPKELYTAVLLLDHMITIMLVLHYRKCTNR